MSTSSHSCSQSAKDQISLQLVREHNQLLQSCLGSTCFVLAAIFTLIAAIDIWQFGPSHSASMIMIGAGNVLVFLCLGWYSNRNSVSIRYVNSLAAGIAAGVLLHLLFREYLVPSPIHVSILVMFIYSLSVFFLSTRWLVGAVVVSATASLAVILPTVEQSAQHDLLLMFCAGSLFSLVLHLFRSRAYRQMGQLRLDVENRAAELKEVVSQSEMNENKLRRVSEAIPFGIFQIDTEGYCEYTNNNWRTLCIASGAFQVKHRWSDILCEEIREDAFKDWQVAAQNCEQFRGVYRQKNKAGKDHWLEISISPVFADEGAVYVGTAENITEKKLAHDQLQQTANDLQVSKEAQDAYAQKLELVVKELEVAKRKAEQSAQAKSEFLANMSHEIRTPMTAVLGYADLIIEETPSDSHTSESLQAIKRNGTHLLQIINDILDISKIEAGKMDVELMSCSPRNIIDEVLGLIAVRADEKSLSLSATFSGAIPEFIQTDPTRLHQILLNLLSNSIKFTKTGCLCVDVRFKAAGTKHDHPCLEVSVIDTGIGMTDEQAKKLFQPFTQADSSTSRKFGGTGLGLCISQRLAEALGGTIVVESELGKGSTFCLTISTGDLTGTAMIKDPQLPSNKIFCGSDSQKSKPTRSNDVGINKEKETPLDCKLLLVEDGVDNQKLIAFLMKKAGAEVTIAEDGLIGTEKVGEAIEQGKPFDIILMDMQMPVMDGYTASTKLRDEGITTPIIALTAHAMTGDREKCIQAGCSDYTTKPINRNKLTAMIKSHLNASAAASC